VTARGHIAMQTSELVAWPQVLHAGSNSPKEIPMAKYSKSAGKDVESEMKRYNQGTAKSGPGGKGGKVKSRKQAIAIGLSKARKKGKKVPKKRL
jgi:hypothetical protein